MKRSNPRKAFKAIMKSLKGQGYRKDLQSVSITYMSVYYNKYWVRVPRQQCNVWLLLGSNDWIEFIVWDFKWQSVSL